MGVIRVAVIPARLATRDSLELCVLLKSWRSIPSAADATAKPHASASGALIHGGLVASNWRKIIPKPPKAVTKQEITVGLKADTPGASLASAPASTWPPLPSTCP